MLAWKVLPFVAAWGFVAQAGALPSPPSFPLDGGFSNGERWWTARGTAGIASGEAQVGLARCVTEQAYDGEIGAVTSSPIPNLPFRTLRYHLRSSADPGDVLEVLAVGPGRTVHLDGVAYRSNVNCLRLDQARSVELNPVALAGEPWFRLEFKVTYRLNNIHMTVFVDNVALST